MTNKRISFFCFIRCFVRDPSFQLTGTKCNIISVNDDGEAIFHHSLNSESPSAEALNRVKSEHNYIKLAKEPKPLGRSFNLCFKLPPISEPPSPSSTINSPQIEKLKMAELPMEGSTSKTPSRKFCDPNFVLRLPLKLSREEIEEITLGFSMRISADESQHFVVFEGFFTLYQSRVLVKMFRGDSGGVFLQAERKAALSMRHKNIMRLLGYNQSEDTTFLVFPFAERCTLDLCLAGKFIITIVFSFSFDFIFKNIVVTRNLVIPLGLAQQEEDEGLRIEFGKELLSVHLVHRFIMKFLC